MSNATKQAAEIIGFVLGWDITDVKDGVYQPTRYSSPRIYVCGNDYFCCPPAGKTPPARDGWNWQKFGEAYGRTVYCSKA